MTTPEEVKPYGDANRSKKEEVAAMFDAISNRYDLLNRTLSLGIDRGWRKKAIALVAQKKPKAILDVATGTGDLAIAATKQTDAHIIGVDISEGMLEMGRKKISQLGLTGRIELRYGDSEALPFPDAQFDAITVAFGVRNFGDLNRGLSELFRVLKPGGMLMVLEFSKPRHFPVKQLYGFYFRYILPAVGRLVSRDRSAYQYLPASVQVFPDGENFLNILNTIGFTANSQIPLTFGIASLYRGTKPAV